MKNKSIIGLLIFTLSSLNNIWGQTIPIVKKTKYERVTQTYEFVKIQDGFLSLFKKQFPQLELNILKSELAFNTTFGKSNEGMKKYLNEFIGEVEFNKYEGRLNSDMKTALENISFVEQDAVNFIGDVEKRAKGIIDTPILETLLYFQYTSNPQGEFLAGFTTKYSTKGHSKSKNTDWQIKIPKSWKAEEGERPNIIQKFTSDYGNGNESFMLLVNELDLPVGYKMTNDELNSFFSEKEMNTLMTTTNRKFISFSKMTIENNIGGMVECEQISERMGVQIKMRLVQFMFIKENKMYILFGSVSSSDILMDLEVEMKKYLPLFKQIVNSCVLNDQYK